MKLNADTQKLLFAVVAVLLATVLVAGPFALDAQAKDERQAQSAYKAARKALNADQYRNAAEMFKNVYNEYPKSKYAAEAMYWQAFALHRIGGKSELREAQRVLERQLDKYSDTSTREDASELYYIVIGKLAEMGDAEAAERLAEDTEILIGEGEREEPEVDIEEKLAALHALINMRSDKALPILKKLLTDPDPANAELREKSLFLLAQHDSDEAVDILVHVAREDPDPDVRKQAVFWLSQTSSDKAREFLGELLTETDDPELQEKAIFALSQIGDREAFEALQRIAMDKSQSDDLRAQAIFWLGQGGGLKEEEFLRQLYGELDEDELKERVIFSVSQNSRGGDWLISIINDEKESTEVRKQALFWAGQSGAIDANGIVKVYKTSKNPELREQAIFALSQCHEEDAVGLMIEMARKEKDPDLRKKLVFWIGQSNDPRAEEFLVEIIND